MGVARALNPSGRFLTQAHDEQDVRWLSEELSRYLNSYVFDLQRHTLVFPLTEGPNRRYSQVAELFLGHRSTRRPTPSISSCSGTASSRGPGGTK